MKKLMYILLAGALVLSFATTGFCNRDSYATGLLGVSLPADSDLSSPGLAGIDAEVSYEPGAVVGVAVGHDFGSYRFEGEVAYQQNNLDEISALGASAEVDGDISLFTVLLNGYYEFVPNGRMTPYLTAGFGLASAEFDLEGTSEQDAVTAFQVGAGISYFISEEFVIDFKYRYLVTSDLELDNLDVDFTSHNIMIGFSKRF